MRVFFDLIKGYKYQSLIDQTSIKLFFAKEIPETFSIEKKIEMMKLALDKIGNTKEEEAEQKYMFFELGFMPIIIHHSEDPEFFNALVDARILEVFFQTFFIFQLVQKNYGPQRVSTTQLLKNELETSYSVSYESFHIEIIKVVNLFLDHFPNYSSFAARTYQEFDCKPINHFLNQCAKRASNSILKEWAFYTTTLLYCKILEDQFQEQQYIKMAIEGGESILMLILQHSQNINSKSLVQKSFSNLIKIMTNPQVLALAEEKKDYIPICMKRALNFEGRHTSSLIYLCNFIIAHEDFFYQHNQTFQNKLFKVISKFTQQYQPNIISRQLTVEIAQVLINWSERSINNLPQDSIENLRTHYMQFNSQILYQLIRTSIMLHGNHPDYPIKDILEISTKCLQLIKKIIILHNNMRIQFPIFNKLLQNDNDERENISLIRMILLNVSQILIKHQQESQDFKKFFLEFICNIKTRYYKCILFSTKIIREIVFMSSEPEFSQAIAERIGKILNENVRTCNEQNIDKIQQDIQQVEEKCHKNKQPIAFSFQDVAKCIFSVIPHFTIRLISKIDQDLEEDPNFKYQSLYQFNNFEFIRDLSQCLFKIVMNFRKNILFDQNEFGKNFKGVTNIQFQAVNANTQYTPEQLIILNDEIVELKPEEPNYDLFNKESIMMGLLIIAKKLKTMESLQAIQIFELLQHMMNALFKFNNNEYILEWLKKIVDVLIIDKVGDISKLQLDKKCAKILGICDISQNNNLQLNSIFEQCVNFLEKQPTLYQDNTNRIFEKAFINTNKKSPALKQKLFSIFEKFNGTSLFAKLKFFFTKHQIDDNEKQQFFTAQSQLLDFTLYNFKTDVPLSKTKHSSRLFPLNNPCIEIDSTQVAQFMGDDENEYENIRSILQPIQDRVNKYKNLQLRHLMDPLSEIININPSHTQDKQLSDKLFIKVFWQYWNILTREEQQFLSESINKFFLRCIPSSGQTVDRNNLLEKSKRQQTKLFLEAVAALSPQLRIDPEVLQQIGKTQNLWHVCIPIIENHILVFPQNERYVFALNELYNKLMEEDYLAGLRRSITDSKETRSMISYGQHHKWEEINQQFSYFIDFYAEQEGLYAQMDREQDIPGKYSCQISKDFIHKSQIQLERQRLQSQLGPDEQMSQQQLMQQSEINYINPFNTQEHKDLISSNNFPKDGPNKFVREIDLRIWETLFIDSVKILNRWEQYRDIAHTMQNQEMWIEFFWNIKKWEELKYFEKTLSESDSIQYQLYYIYYIIQSKRQQEFDAIFKKVISSSYQQWDSQCPSYIDNIQFENLIMYQLVMESSEGGRNMIKEAENLRHKNKMSEIKTAINIWRERVPHQCERIQMWKEVLENRNFIYEQISEIIAPNLRTNVSQGQEQDQNIRNLNDQRRAFVNELLDKAWNYAKLAQVSRKQGLPTLCLHYLQLAKKIFENSSHESFRYEKFKCEYELLKLHMNYNQLNPSMPSEVEKMRSQVEENKHYEPHQRAEFYRLFGEHYLYQGNLKDAQAFLSRSLELNKKEAKGWMSYAKLNEQVFNEIKEEKTIFNSIKGYLCATVLNLHKARLIIPYVLKLLRRRDISNQQPISMATLQKLMKNYIDQMPTWIWLFWIPQLITFLFAHNQMPEFNFAKYVLYKMSKLYPQAVIYSLKFKQSMSKTGSMGGGDGPSSHDNAHNMISELLKIVKNTTPIATSLILQIGKELVEKIKMSPEEELQILLGKILQFNQFFSSESIESDFKSFLDHVYKKFFKEEILSKSKVLKSINKKFYDDFINPETSEKDILTLITKLKNFKDFIQKKLSLSIMQTCLEEISPFLANFNERGVELPGQYMIIDSEPLPEQTIYISRFDPVIYRNGINSKKIAIRGSNQKIYAFSMSYFQYVADFQKFCSEERILQLKMVMNQIFSRNKETLRRGAKFYTPIKFVIQNSVKLSQDDLTFASLQDIHDYLLQERGLDSDIAMNLSMQKVNDLFDTTHQEGEPRLLSQITLEQIRQINQDTYDLMRTQYCQPYLLSSFFHRIFYTVDDLFIFKKQFTIYHSVNSFFNYIFNQQDFYTLSALSFCKTSGRLNLSECRLTEWEKKNNLLKQLIQTQGAAGAAQISFTKIEEREYQSSYNIPFRLTNNITDFIGKYGLNGLFVGVVTACSLALTKNSDKMYQLLYLIMRDEVSACPGLGQDGKDDVNFYVDYLIHKIRSLSQNNRIITYPERNQQMGNQDENLFEERKDRSYRQIGSVKVRQEYLKFEIEKPRIFEEFNKKIIDLMELSMDPNRLSQQPSNWFSWF